MRKYLKQGIALMLSLVLVLTLSACGGKTGNEDKIVIAYIGPLTGGSAIYGIVESDTVQMLVEETNENGGLLGKQLELKIYDNRDDAVETTNAARKAIQNDGVVAFIGPDASTTAIALDEVCKEYGIPHITTCGTNYKVTQREEDGSVREYYVEMTHQAKIRGNIYKGVINNIDTNLQAAFVNYGNVKNGFLQIDGQPKDGGTGLHGAAGHPADGGGHLFERRRAAVVLLPEERHARGAEKTEKFEQFGGALAFITGEKDSAKVKNDVFHRDKDTKKSNGAQHKIAHNSVKPSDW